MFKTKNTKKKYRTKRRARKISSKRVVKIKRKKPTSRRQKIKKPINWKKVGVVFLAICFLILVCWVLFFSLALEIKNVEVAGFGDKQRIINEANEIKQGFILGKLSKNNLILFSKKQFINKILEDDIRIKKVEVVKKFPDTLVVKIVEREKLFLWHFSDGCWFYDEDGMEVKSVDCIIDKNKLARVCRNDKLTGGLNCLVVWTDINRKDFDNNLIKEKSQFVEHIFNFLKQTTYFNSSILISIPSVVTGEIKVKNSQHGDLLFDANNDIDKQLKTLKAFLEQKISLSELQQMDYIDLRIKNKLIYKFKESSESNEDKNEEQEKNKNEGQKNE